MLEQSILDAIAAKGITDPEAAAELFDERTILELMEFHADELEEERFGKFRNIFPETYRELGEMRYFPRDRYPKHMAFFAAGKKYRARCFMAANRVGKTFSGGGYEMACHLTGQYPEWWPGRRFRHPIRAWACGKTNETTRDIVQTTLVGDIEFQGPKKVVDGSGIIPRECLGTGAGQITWKAGVADLIDTIKIQHTSGGWSKLGLKSYQQGRGSFEGTAQHVIWDDEEPPMDVYGEQIIRTATTKGLLMLTFTPLAGMSEVVQQFLNEDDYAG